MPWYLPHQFLVQPELRALSRFPGLGWRLEHYRLPASLRPAHNQDVVTRTKHPLSHPTVKSQSITYSVKSLPFGNDIHWQSPLGRGYLLSLQSNILRPIPRDSLFRKQQFERLALIQVTYRLMDQGFLIKDDLYQDGLRALSERLLVAHEFL